MPAPNLEPAEQALIERLRAGDKAACAQCVDEHADGLYRIALRMMRNEAEAEDVVQEALLSAFRAIQSFDGRSSLKTWLYRIAYNAALMRLRRNEPVTVPVGEPDDDAETPPVELRDWCCLPEEEFESAAARAELERAIGELSPRLREVFALRELEELSTEETARTLGVTEAVVKVRLHRARLWLRERLAGYFSEFVQARN